MIFEWDESKNKSNYRKHNVWFDEAQTIWANNTSIEFEDPVHSQIEERFIRLGYSSAQKLLLVVFCERLDGQVIRIISARKATRKEKRQYEEGI